MLATAKHPPLWYALLLVAVPILVGETCVAIREHLRREHKARLRRREIKTESPS